MTRDCGVIQMTNRFVCPSGRQHEYLLTDSRARGQVQHAAGLGQSQEVCALLLLSDRERVLGEMRTQDETRMSLKSFLFVMRRQSFA